jgi:hypothetical protein
LGDDFDLRAFHRHILTCVGPLQMLEQCVIDEESLSFPNMKPRDPRGISVFHLLAECYATLRVFIEKFRKKSKKKICEIFREFFFKYFSSLVMPA